MLEPSLISAEQQLSSSLNIGANESCDNNVFFAENNDPREQILWNVNKSRIDFYKYDTDCQNQLLSCFNFEEIYNDPNLVISFVIRCVDRFEESHNRHHPFKVIVTLNSHDGSSVVIIDIITGSVLSTIAFPYTICSLELISGSKDSILNRPFGEAIRALDGILAVGTVGGNVFLLDLRLDSLPDDPLSSTQVTFSNIHKATINEIMMKRAAAVQHQQNVAFMLNSFAKTKHHFVYTKADKKTILNRFAAQNVYVSCLYYIPTNCSLAVGFNFGGLQMISLQQDFQLELSQELVYETPVVGFSHQLPESDPKNFIYFWVIRGIHQKSLGLEINDQCTLCSKAYLYRAIYDKRSDTNFGISYSKFIQYECVFYIPLVFNPQDLSSKSSTSSRLLEIFSISKYFTIDGQETVDNRYTVIVWSAESTKSEKIVTNFMIFDLNQWYLYFDSKCSQSFMCPYLTFYSLEAINGLVSNKDRIQALSFLTNSIRKFIFKGYNEPDNSFYSPRCLSFDVIVSSQEKLFSVKFLSLQKQTLKEIYSSNINPISKPSASFCKLKEVGLIPRETPDHNCIYNILNVGLDYSQFCFLKKAILIECEQENILEWIYERIISAKKSIVDNTSSLFDYSGSPLSPEQQRNLISNECHLRLLLIVLKIFKPTKNIVKDIPEKVQALREVTEQVMNFLKVIFNLHHMNILPERLAQNCSSDQTFYDGDSMRASYEQERKNIMNLCSNAFPDLNKVLIIDLIVQYFSEPLKEAWRIGSDDSKISDPLYPPTNLHCLCRTFILENSQIPKVVREFILIYFLIDYSRINQQDQEFLASVLPFFRSYVMDPKMQDLVVGIWHADHGDYDTALSFFCSSNTLKAFKDFRSLLPDLFGDIIDRIIELFMFHDRTKQALNFIEISEIFPLDSVNESLYVYLLVCDLKLISAIDFQRRRRTEEFSPLFQSFLEFCDQKSCLHSLCFIELDEFEELMLLNYLHESELQSQRLILVFYYLSKNLFVDALNFVTTYDVDFEDVPQLFELIQKCENVVPLKELNSIAKGMEILRAKCNENGPICGEDKLGMKFDDNQPLMKVYPKKSSKIVISKTLSIEQALIAKDSFLKKNELFKTFKDSSVRSSLTPNMTPNQRKSLGFTPIMNRSSMKTKIKISTKKFNPFAAVLSTPDIKKQILADISSKSVNRPPSVLKRLINDSESIHSSDSSKIKVNVKFKLPKGNPISPVYENSGSIDLSDHLTLEKTYEVDDVETNETIGDFNPLDSSHDSLSNVSKEFEMPETPLPLIDSPDSPDSLPTEQEKEDIFKDNIKISVSEPEKMNLSEPVEEVPAKKAKIIRKGNSNKSENENEIDNLVDKDSENHFTENKFIRRSSRRSVTPQRFEDNISIPNRPRSRTPPRELDQVINLRRGRSQTPLRESDRSERAQTPVRRSTRARTPVREEPEITLTPTRKGKKSKLISENDNALQEETKVLFPPIIRKRESKLKDDETEEISDIPKVNLKLVNKKKGLASFKEEIDKIESKRTPIRNAKIRTKEEEEVLVSESNSDVSVRRSKRATTPTRHFDEEIFTKRRSATPNRELKSTNNRGSKGRSVRNEEEYLSNATPKKRITKKANVLPLFPEEENSNEAEMEVEKKVNVSISRKTALKSITETPSKRGKVKKSIDKEDESLPTEVPTQSIIKKDKTPRKALDIEKEMIPKLPETEPEPETKKRKLKITLTSKKSTTKSAEIKSEK